MTSNLIGQTFHREKLPNMFEPAGRAVVVVDESGSRAYGPTWQAVEQDAVTLTNALESRGTQVGVASFSCDAHCHKQVDAQPAAAALGRVFAQPEAMGSDGLRAGIHMAATMLGGPGLVLVLTDGMVMPSAAFKQEVSQLERHGIQVVGVGLPSDRPGDLGNVFNEYYRTAE